MKRFMVISLLSSLVMGQINCADLPVQTGQENVSNTGHGVTVAGALGFYASIYGSLKAVSSDNFMGKISFLRNYPSFLGSSSPAIATKYLIGQTAFFGGLACLTYAVNNSTLKKASQNDAGINLNDSDTYPTVNKIAEVATGALVGCALGSLCVLSGVIVAH